VRDVADGIITNVALVVLAKCIPHDKYTKLP
jgi:hypothetical protein